jgi:hypothetical protein
MSGTGVAGWRRHFWRLDEDQLVEATVETAAEPAAARRGLLARFARDRRGVAALEFGMVSIPFLGLLCAIFETAFVYYNHEVFDNAVANVARQILVNQYASQTNASVANPNAATWLGTKGTNGYSFCGGPGAALPAYFNCADVRVKVSAYAGGFGNLTTGGASPFNRDFTNGANTNFAQIAQTATTLDLGKPGNIVVFQAFYPMPIYLSVLLSSGAQGNQATNLYGQAGGSVNTNPTSGTGLVHYIYSVMVFRNEPQ